MRRFKGRLILGALLAAFVLWPGSASAAVTVNTTADASAPGCMGAPGDCSLRQAITAAAPGDTVIVPAGSYSLTLGPLSIAKALTVQGAGARTTSVVLASGSTHVFSVASTNPVTISGLTISTGHLTGTGSAFQHGGAVLNNPGSMLTLVADAISGTTLDYTNPGGPGPPPVRGAGVYNDNGAHLTLINSTVSGNVQRTSGGVNPQPVSLQGAGLFNTGGTVAITNSTITGNSQEGPGGTMSSGAGIANVSSSTVDLLNVTIAGNAGSANISNPGGNTTTARDTIISNGASGNCSGTLSSLGHNIESANECGLAAVGDQTGTDPLLGPLADNGGPTDTMALLPGSPAIDHGDPAVCPATDQRGIPRPQAAACDVGAFELVPSTALPSNLFTIGKPKLNKRKGTAKLPVTVPGHGTLALTGKGIVKQRPARGAQAGEVLAKTVGAAGTVKLLVKTKGKAKRKLNARGKLKVKLTISFTPTGGTAASQTKSIKLKKRPRRR